MVRCPGLEVDRGDRDQLPTFVAEAVQFFGAAWIHRIVLRPHIDDLVFPGLHDLALPMELFDAEWIRGEVYQTLGSASRHRTASAGTSAMMPSQPAARRRSQSATRFGVHATTRTFDPAIASTTS